MDGRSSAAELGSRQDTALKPWVVLTKASHYFRLMLPDGHSLGAKNQPWLVTHTLGRTWGTSSPSQCTLDCMGRTLQDWGPDSRVFSA